MRQSMSIWRSPLLESYVQTVGKAANMEVRDGKSSGPGWHPQYTLISSLRSCTAEMRS
jgi:hypothetical protein